MYPAVPITIPGAVSTVAVGGERAWLAAGARATAPPPPPRRAGLVLEPAQAVGIGGEGRRKHLHGDVPPEPGIAGAIDFSHPSGAERRQDLVGSEEGSGRDHHVGCG